MGYWSLVIRQLGFLFSSWNTVMIPWFHKMRKFLDQLNWYKLENTNCSLEVFGRILVQKRGAKFPGATSPWRLDYSRWRLKFVGPQYEACYMSSFWRFEFGSGH
jgi:hypothetical protein